MHATYDMHDLNPGAHDPNTGSSVEQNNAYSLEYENNVLHQQLLDLSLKCFKVGTFDVRASDVVPLIDDQTRGQESMTLELMIVVELFALLLLV